MWCSYEAQTETFMVQMFFISRNQKQSGFRPRETKALKGGTFPESKSVHQEHMHKIFCIVLESIKLETGTEFHDMKICDKCGAKSEQLTKTSKWLLYGTKKNYPMCFFFY